MQFYEQKAKLSKGVYPESNTSYLNALVLKYRY